MNRPRHYAALIVQAAGDVALQREIFAACPFEMRAQVRDLTKLALYQAKKVEEHTRLIQQARVKVPASKQSSRKEAPHHKSDHQFGQERIAELRAAVGGAR